MKSCLSASLVPVGGVSASAVLVTGSDARMSRIGGMDASAARVSYSGASAERVGGMYSFFSLVCSVDLHATEGYLRTTEGYVLTINGGYIVLPLMS